MQKNRVRYDSKRLLNCKSVELQPDYSEIISRDVYSALYVTGTSRSFAMKNQAALWAYDEAKNMHVEICRGIGLALDDIESEWCNVCFLGPLVAHQSICE